jgi:large subunit ribosomal protein L45
MMLYKLQKLAIYDQFGRLLLGSEEVAREVIEYVIFENHVASVDGRWRILDKIYPKWSKPKEGVVRTFQVKADDEEHRTTEPVDLELTQTSDTAISDSDEKPKNFRT